MTTITKKFNVIAVTKTITETDGTLYLEGIANTGQEDLIGDIVTEQALKQIVEQAPYRNLHYNHEGGKNELLGRIVESELRPEGAWIKTRILEEQKAWLQSYLDQGIIFGQSISGTCTYEEYSASNINSWNLTEISLTDTPCDPGTMGSVSVSKSFDDLLSQIQKKKRLEENNMAEDGITKEEAIQIVNDAFNERKEELLEQLRGDLAKEYDAVINELKEKIESIESTLESIKKPEEGDEGKPADDEKPQEGKSEEDEEEEKRFQEALEKAVSNRVEEILNGLAKDVSSKYDANQHITDKQEEKSVTVMNASDIAKML